MGSNIKSPTCNCMLLRMLLLLVVCIGGSLARHWCQWTAGPCSVTCGDEGVIRRSRVCSCKRNRSNVFGKMKDKFVELINRDCRRLSPQVELIECPDLTRCDDGRPNANQIIAACIVTIVLLCVLFASAKTWVPALYKYYFVDRDRRRRRRQQQQLRRESMLAHPGPQVSVNRPAGGGGVDSSSDNLSVSFESSNGQQSVEPPEPPPQLQQPPLPPTYHDAVYGEVSGEPPPSYTEAVKEQRLREQQQQQQQLEQTQLTETPNLNVESESNDPLRLQSTQHQLPGPSESPNVV